jgi:glycine cleavage system H protein
MQYPDHLAYSSVHLWIDANGEAATIGVTEDLQEEIEDLTSIDLPLIGDELEIDAMCVVLHHSEEQQLDLPSPLTGRVTAVNESLTADPGELFLSPYGTGWLFKMEFDEPEELDMLMTAEEYTYEHDA